MIDDIKRNWKHFLCYSLKKNKESIGSQTWRACNWMDIIIAMIRCLTAVTIANYVIFLTLNVFSNMKTIFETIDSFYCVFSINSTLGSNWSKLQISITNLITFNYKFYQISNWLILTTFRLLNEVLINRGFVF